MADQTKRCRHCGGTLWNDGATLKCLMCSRSPEDGSNPAPFAARLGNPKLPILQKGSPFAKGKK